MPTHYEVLGVAMEATAEDIRRAYLEMARALHPDRALSGTLSEAQRGSRRMQDVNEAWRVLRDPTSRAAYDRALTGRRLPRPQMPFPKARRPIEDDDLDVPFTSPVARPGDLGVSIARVLPWLVLVFVLGAIFVFTAFARKDPGPSSPQDLVGRCISSGSASMVAPVPCQGPNDGEVVSVVDRASLCPEGASGRALEGDVWICVKPFRGPTTTFVFPTTTTAPVPP
jgi:hypothetical protein